MSWHLVRLADVPATPWRNGGGTTRELHVFPVHANWHWRLSVAEISQDGPFSAYEGVQRVFAVIAGAGVRLRWPDRAIALTPADMPLGFDGAEPPMCERLEGTTLDFNLMVRKGHGAMQRVRGEAVYAVSSGSAIALWSGAEAAEARVEGQVQQLPPWSLCWRHMDLGGRVEVKAPDGLWVEIAA